MAQFHCTHANEHYQIRYMCFLKEVWPNIIAFATEQSSCAVCRHSQQISTQPKEKNKKLLLMPYSSLHRYLAELQLCWCTSQSYTVGIY
jgi:hypothetical protein